MANEIATIASPQMAQAMVIKYLKEQNKEKVAQEFSTVVSLMMRNQPKLASVDPQSLFVCVMACAQLDLMPNTPAQYAYIIPYGNNATLQLGYQGLIELAYRTGNIKSINAELVFKEDEFDIELGTDRKLVHKPDFKVNRTDYSKAIAVYATAMMMNGTSVFEVLTKGDLDKVQKTVKATQGDTPWAKWPESMAKKTAIKRLLKYLPSSTIDNRLKDAAQLDSASEGGRKLRFDTTSGEVIEGEVANSEVSEGILDAITSSENKEDLDEIMESLNVPQRKTAAPFIAARLKQMAE